MQKKYKCINRFYLLVQCKVYFRYIIYINTTVSKMGFAFCIILLMIEVTLHFQKYSTFL